MPTLRDLDATFSAEVAAGYSARLTQLVQPDEQLQDQQYEQWQHYQQALSETAVWDILMRVSSSSSSSSSRPRWHSIDSCGSGSGSSNGRGGNSQCSMYLWHYKSCHS